MSDEQYSLATQRSTLGKTQAILYAEAQSERWISWFRLTIGCVFALVGLYSFALEQIPVTSFIMQILAAATMCGYSLVFVSPSAKRWVGSHSVFVVAFLDVSVITAALWSYAVAGWAPVGIHSTLFSTYFLAIAFTALHHKVRLSIFSGLLCAAQYSVLWFVAFRGGMAGIVDGGVVYLTSILLLLVVALLSGLISRNNTLSLNKVVASEVRYHNLVHRLPQMLFTLDSSGTFLWSNMASYAILGVPAKAVARRNIRDHMVNADLFKLDRFGTRGTFEIRDFNGKTKFVDCIIQPAQSDDRRTAWEGSMVDVTDRELAISQREEMSTRLFQYQKMESLGTLASGMAHDFNNILQTSYEIIGRAEEETHEESTRRYMMLISETLTDAKFLVSELLALGRKQPLDYTSIKVSDFLEDIVPLFREQLGSRYEVNVEVADDPLWIQGDPNYLKRIFQNFFGNAKDAMPDGGKITIECYAERKQAEVGNVVLRFSDTGTGIPADLREKIFDPFFTTKKPGKGTGLGLALVRRIIALHNGQIQVEKTGRKGTTFRIEIPEYEVRGEEYNTKAILLSRKSSTVLVMDDDPKIRSILSFFLKELEYDVLEASTMEEGLRQIRENAEDCRIAIMDWKLGEANPHKVIEGLREVIKDLVVIVVSGYPPRKSSIEEMDIFRWFTKPYDKNRLDLEIQKALHMQEKNRSAT